MTASQTTIYPTESAAARYEIVVGDYVVAGDTDCDWGEILVIADDGETATIAWEIGACKTDILLDGDDVVVYQSSDAARAECGRRRDIINNAPVLPIEVHTYQPGGVRCCYQDFVDVAYRDEEEAAADHEASSTDWSAIRHVHHADDRPLTVDEIRDLSPNQAWELYVGEQDVSEFVANGGDPREYVLDCELTANLNASERRDVADKLQEHIVAHRAYLTLRRASAVAATAARLCIEIDPADALAIASADPTYAVSLADAIVDAAHVPLIVAAHPGCTLREDGCVVPVGGAWEVGSEGHYDCSDDDIHADAEVVAKAHRAEALDWVTGRTRTVWVDVDVRLAVVDRSGYADLLRDSIEVVIHPDEPACGHEEGHDWEEGDVYGSGGGVQWRSTCRHCGLIRHTDTWATRPDNGTQGHTSVRYYHDDDLDDDLD